MTRKWRDNRSLVQSVKLFLIDEVSDINQPADNEASYSSSYDPLVPYDI